MFSTHPESMGPSKMTHLRWAASSEEEEADANSLKVLATSPSDHWWKVVVVAGMGCC